MNNLYKRFFKEYLISFKFKYIISLILILIQNIIAICIPLIFSVLIDDALPNKDEKKFLIFVGLMVASSIINNLLEIYKDFIISKISEGVTFKLREELNSKIGKLPNEFFLNNSLSGILSKYEREVSIIKSNSGYMIIEIFGNSCKLILILGLMIYIDIKITLISIAVIGVYLINYKFWAKRVKYISESNMELNSSVIEKITENYNNAMITKLYSAYDYAKNSFINEYRKFYENSIKFQLECSLNINSSSIILFSSVGLLWLIGGYSVMNGVMTIGIMTAMINYQSMLLSPIRFFSQFSNSYQSTIVALKRIYEILDYDEDILGDKYIEEDINNITFDNVCFSYDKSKNVLSNISMNIPKGEITSIVGLSGSGKSTIVKLIAGLNKVSSGNLYINNLNINDVEVHSLRNKVSLISQDSLFFKDTILENLKLSKFSEEDKLVEISKKLDIHDDIISLPSGWDTLLSTGANNLSGGQKKRLDILRALLKDSSVIIFDESTASLDELRRGYLFNLINEIKKDKIILFISHNIKELVNSDKIYIFEDGHLVDINSVSENSDYTKVVKKELAYV